MFSIRKKWSYLNISVIHNTILSLYLYICTVIFFFFLEYSYVNPTDPPPGGFNNEQFHYDLPYDGIKVLKGL